VIAGKASINCYRRAQSSRSECAGDSEWPGTSEDEKDEDGDGVRARANTPLEPLQLWKKPSGSAKRTRPDF
jgi:hypothetical protein